MNKIRTCIQVVRLDDITVFSALNEDKSAKIQDACWSRDIRITSALMSEWGDF